MQNTTTTSTSQKSIVIDCDDSDLEKEKPEGKTVTQEEDQKNEETSESTLYVPLRSDTFSKHMNILHLLRDSDRKEIRSGQPRICLKCWQIVCEGDSAEHPRPAHVLTGPFEKMQPATADSMYGLAKTRSRVGPNDTATVQNIEPFSFSPRMQLILQNKNPNQIASMLKKRSRDGVEGQVKVLSSSTSSNTAGKRKQKTEQKNKTQPSKAADCHLMRPASPGAVDNIQPRSGDMDGSGRFTKQMLQTSQSIIPNVQNESVATISVNGNPVSLIKKITSEKKQSTEKQPSESKDPVEDSGLDATQEKMLQLFSNIASRLGSLEKDVTSLCKQQCKGCQRKQEASAECTLSEDSN